jgi:hypothetical protein
LEKEREGKLESAVSLKEPSLAMMTHFKKEVDYTPYKAINTLCLILWKSWVKNHNFELHVPSHDF